MFTVVFSVPVVIYDINAAGDKGKSDKSIENVKHFLHVEDLTCEEQRYEKEQILRPILRS